MNNLAIIPARGGSKRIPKKNIRPLHGKPVIAYPIRATIDSGLFTEVMVSTEDDEIAGVAENYGAISPFRRSVETAGDYATLAEVLLEVVTEYKKKDRQYDNICCILPTAALITAERLRDSYHLFTKGDFSSLIPVLRFSFPIQRALKVREGLLSLREPEHTSSRSQDLEVFYHDAAQFYWIKNSQLLDERTLFTKKTGYIEVQETEAQDVDNEMDWEMLQLKFNKISIKP